MLGSGPEAETAIIKYTNVSAQSSSPEPSENHNGFIKHDKEKNNKSPLFSRKSETGIENRVA